MEVKTIVTYFGLIYLGVLLPKTFGEQNYDLSTEYSDNMPTLLFPSSPKSMEQDDNDLTLQSKTNMVQETESSQNKITSRQMGLQSNMIATTFNKEPLTGETIKDKATNKGRYFTSAISSTEERSENNDNEVPTDFNRITKRNGVSDLGVNLPSTTSQTLMTRKFRSTQPSTTKVIEEMPSELCVTNATETSISLSWNAPEDMTQFKVIVRDQVSKEETCKDVQSTNATIGNLTCSGCPYNISVKGINNNLSQSVSITNYTVPKMPNVSVEINPTSVTIRINIGSNNCETLKNNNTWPIEGSTASENNCQIEKSDLQKGFDYHLMIWRKVDVWESKRKLITFHLNNTVPIAVKNLIYQSSNKEMNISWQKPNDSIVTSYMINIYFENPYTSDNINKSTRLTYYVITNLKPGSAYTVSVYAVNSIGNGPTSFINFTVPPEIPDAVHISINEITATSVNISFSRPTTFKGVILGYVIQIYEKYNKTSKKKNLKTHNIICKDCKQVYTDSPSCPCSTNCLSRQVMSLTEPLTFGDLTSYTRYSILAQAYTSAGCSKESKRAFNTTESVPDPVNLEIVTTTSKSIMIKWKPPLHSNGPIKNYSIYYDHKTVPDNTTGPNTTTYNIINLEPYTNYTIKVKICNTLYCKESKPISQRTMAGVPHTARNVRAKAMSATSILVQWEAPFVFTGPTSYIIMRQSVDQTNELHKPLLGPFVVNGFNNTSITISDLQEYWLYKFSVTTNTTAGKGAPILTEFTRTDESTPGPVQSLDIRVNYSKNIALLVTWMKPLPEDENGIILNYEITYWWTDNKEKKNISVNATVFSTAMIAFGEHNYTIQIKAKTSKGFGVIRSKTTYVKAEIPVVPDVVISKANQEVDDNSGQIAINLPNGFFTDFRFGKPMKWGLIVAQSEAVNKSALENKELILDKLKRWRDVYSMEISYPYRPTPADWKPLFVLAQDKDTPYTLGDEEDCENGQFYCNGYLKPNTGYRVKAYMCTKAGCAATRYSEILHTDKDLTPIYITVPVLLIAAGVAINIIFIMWHKKLYCFKKNPIITISSLVDANQNGKVNHSFMLKNCDNTRPIMLAHFDSKVAMMKRDTNLQFCEEFKLLKCLSVDQPHVAAELQANRTKNRYTNILAYDHSRVKLLPLDDDEGSDYINANYIPGHSRFREYIAAQGPLHSTKDDFWRMIWEQNTSIVVMVTLPVERGRVKCEDYWPVGTEPVYFGDLVVQLKSESNLSDYVIRIMDVNLGESTREVKQFHFLKWPDFGCPHNTSLLINFVQTVRTHMPYMNTGPILVHCSAGVGRTGTFIVIDRLLQHLQTHHEVDIFGLILELRQYRPNMVQTEDQYIYIYQCIADHLKQLEKCASEDIYINDTGI